MSSELDWIFPRLKNTSKLWKLCSYTVIGAVGFVSKIIIGKDFNGKIRFLFDGQSYTIVTNSIFFGDFFITSLFLSYIMILSPSTTYILHHVIYRVCVYIIKTLLLLL